ncbi:MAG: hypothetical protein ACYC5N_00635 [Endomicrobiales bacterium]
MSSGFGQSQAALSGQGQGLSESSSFLSVTRTAGNYSFSLRGGPERYEFPQGPALSGSAAGLSLAYQGQGGGATADFTRRTLGGPKDSLSLSYWITMLKQVNMRLSFASEDPATSLKDMRSMVSGKYATATLSYAPLRNVTLSYDIRKGDISDGNSYHTQGLETRVSMFDGRSTDVYALFRMERQMYDHASSRYYSPSDQTSFSGTVGVKSETPLSGERKVHYDLSVTADKSTGSASIQPKAGVSFDVSEAVSARVQCAQTLFPSTNDGNISFSLTLRP